MPLDRREQIRSDIEQKFGTVPAFLEQALIALPLQELEAAWNGTVALWSQPSADAAPALDSSENLRLLALGADIGVALTTQEALPGMLQGCAEAMVKHLDAAFARVWLLGDGGKTLELEASAGLYTHLDGPHGRVPVGEFKIGRIAASREAHLTNDVQSDPNVSDQDWARREGMIAFAGYPLVLGDELIGVVALFARQTLSDTTLRALASVANEIAVGVKRKQTETILQRNEEELRKLFDTMAQGVILQDETGHLVSANPAAERMLGVTLDEIRGRNSEDPRWQSTHEDGSPYPGEEHPPMVALRTGLPQHNAVMGVYNPLLDETRWLSLASTPQFRAGESKPHQVYTIFEDITQRRHLENEQMALLDAARSRAERANLINRISQAISDDTDPEEIQAAAAALLGEALGADRCYYASYDFDDDTITVMRDWHRADLESMEGRLGLTGVEALFRNYYSNSLTKAVDDLYATGLSGDVKSANDIYRIRARLSVAMPGDAQARIVPTLIVAMTDTPRAWSREEVQLVETVAALTRAASESARLRQRERNIATQLQQALQPSVPEMIPGLALSRYYKAALDEAGVGGDFYDVFPVDKGCTALVVGDLSGKGLAAASQVATVRNMLRTVLYLGNTTSDALETLNQLLATHGLLTGFATLFVGLFDSLERSLTYVNCGQDPALIWRAASGEVERLEPTGTVIGPFENSTYAQKSVAMQPGDTLAIFTDGLTEAGPNRRQLLQIGGVAEQLTAAIYDVRSRSEDDTAPDAGAVADALIDRVQTYAADGVRDDICLLLGVVEAGLGEPIRPFGAPSL